MAQITTPETYDLVSVGEGPTALFLCRGYMQEFLNRGWSASAQRVGIIGSRERVGPGTAWDESHALMSSNMHKGTLCIFGATNAFGTGFDTDVMSDLLLPHGAQPGHQGYIPREQVGDRLAQLHQENLGVAGGLDASIEHIRAEVIEIMRDADGFRLLLTDGRTVRTRCVVLALGLLSVDRYPHLARRPRYHRDSWRCDEILDQISEDHRVAIVGLGPTGIDWLLRLANRDFRQPILMTSRSGLLPAARPQTLGRAHAGLVDPKFLKRLANDTPFTPREIDLIIWGILDKFGVTSDHLDAHRALLRSGPRELMEQTLDKSHEVQPLFEALKLIDDLASVIWRSAGEEGRNHIMNRWSRHYALLSFAVPPSNARAVIELLDTHRLRIRQGLGGVSWGQSGFNLHLDGANGQPKVETVDVLINATGFDGPLTEVNNRLVRSMLGAGLLCEASYGGICMDYETGQVLGCDGRKVEGLYAAGGSLTRTAGYLVNSIIGTSEHGLAVGMACARYLQTREGHADKKTPRLPELADPR